MSKQRPSSSLGHPIGIGWVPALGVSFDPQEAMELTFLDADSIFILDLPAIIEVIIE
jgi:hypothetical protein